MTFLDHFSQVARIYATHRPHYPAELFTWLASIAPSQEQAWDAGTGNGQAAVGLAEHFKRVTATDASAAQIAAALAHERVHYSVSPCDRTGSPDASIDLVTAAAAAHWFPLDSFYAEVRRVIRPGGIIALWTYWRAQVSAEVDPIIEHFQYELMGPYWPPERQYVDAAYRTLPFPFAEISAPEFTATAEMDITRYLQYLRTWSAVQRYQSLQGTDPIALIGTELREAWGREVRAVRWPLAIRAGRG